MAIRISYIFFLFLGHSVCQVVRGFLMEPKLSKIIWVVFPCLPTQWFFVICTCQMFANVEYED